MSTFKAALVTNVKSEQPVHEWVPKSLDEEGLDLVVGTSDNVENSHSCQQLNRHSALSSVSVLSEFQKHFC